MTQKILFTQLLLKLLINLKYFDIIICFGARKQGLEPAKLHSPTH
jgi:hypothetical protein